MEFAIFFLQKKKFIYKIKPINSLLGMFYKLCPLILLVGKGPNKLQLESSLACVGIIGSKQIPQLSLLSLAIGMLHLSFFLRKYTLAHDTD